MADGTRKWHCPRCVWLIKEEADRLALESSLEYRAARAAARSRLILTTGIAVVLVLGVSAAVIFAGARRFGTAATDQSLPGRAAACGELTRMRSIGAIGTQGPEDALNLFTYPQRAEVRLQATTAASAGAELGSIVDDCNTGWKLGATSATATTIPGTPGTPGATALSTSGAAGTAAGGIQLPLSLTIDTKRDGSFVQRIALWQDPTAPRTAWVRDFELLASTSETADDFTPLGLDREALLRESAEPQWFELMRPGPGAAQQKFPEAVPIRRLQVRILSTWGTPRLRATVDQVALGEVAAYGPDLELVIADTDSGDFALKPYDIRALAGQPKFVMVMNQSKVATHRLVSAGQERNFDVTVEPGQVKSVQFVAGRTGRYEYVCKILGHELRGLTGSIQVR